MLFFALYFYYKRKDIFICFFAILWFVFWIYISDYNYLSVQDKVDFVYSLNEKEKLEVEIKNIDKIKEDKIVYTWKLLNVNDNIVDKKIDILVSINSKRKLNRWTIIAFESKVYPVKEFNNFKYDKYMYSKNIYFNAYPYSYKITWEKEINPIISVINSFRGKVLSDIKELYTYEEAIFLSWILIWAREEMPEQLWNNFNNSWLTHVIAVSGFNITILILFFSFIVKPLPAIARFLVISFLIILFTILVGYNPPVIRAAIMWIIWYFILISWRKWNSLAIIIFTAMLMVIYSPLSINYDVSLHLSFLAVLWILYLEPYIEKKLSFITNIFEIRTALSITLAALIFTLPVMLFNFWQISIISPLSNILVSWTIPIIMFLSFFSIILYIILPITWIFFSFVPWLLLKWDILIVNTLWDFEYSTLKYDFWTLSWFLELVCIVALFFAIYYNQNKKIKEKLEDHH